MASDEAHAHCLAGEHAMLCEGGLFFGGVVALGVLEEADVELVHFSQWPDYPGSSTCCHATVVVIVVLLVVVMVVV